MHSASDDYTVHKWDIRKSSSISEGLYKHYNSVYHLALSNYKYYLASAGDDSNVKVYSILEKKL